VKECQVFGSSQFFGFLWLFGTIFQ